MTGKRLGKIIAIAALAFAILIWLVATGEAAWSGDSTYEECMLSRMKGQNQLMYSTVDKVCKQKFKKETYVPRSEVKYQFYGEGLIGRIEFSESDEYIVTRMKARFSGKSCKETKDEDWGEMRDIEVANNFGFVVREGKEIPAGLEGCMNATEFFGIYK